MHNELTQKDIKLMQEELDHRRIHLRPQLLEAICQRTTSTRRPSRRKTATRAVSASWRT